MTVALAYITCPNLGVAEMLAQNAIEARLAACANIVDAVTSLYSWQGKIQKNQEVLLILKSSQANFEKLKNFIEAEHPYEVPCVMQLSIDDVNRAYSDWIHAQLTQVK